MSEGHLYFPPPARFSIGRASTPRGSSGILNPPRFDLFLILNGFRAEPPWSYLAGFPFHLHRRIEIGTHRPMGPSIITTNRAITASVGALEEGARNVHQRDSASGGEVDGRLSTLI